MLPVRFIPGVTSNVMKHHFEGWCPANSSHDDIILHHSANYLERDDNSEYFYFDY